MNKKWSYIIILLFLILSLIGSCVFIYKRLYIESTNEENINKDKEKTSDVSKKNTISLEEEMFIKYYDFMHSHTTSYTLFEKYREIDEYKNVDIIKKLTDEGILYDHYYVLSDNFEERFYNVFSKNVKIEDYYCKEEDNCSTGLDFRFAIVNNKYYIDAECRAGGYFMTIKEITKNNQTSDTIDYSVAFNGVYSSCDENCEHQNIIDMQIIKEDNTWKVNKVSKLGTCDYLEKDS